MNCNDHEPRVRGTFSVGSCHHQLIRIPRPRLVFKASSIPSPEMLICTIVGIFRSIVGTVGVVVTCSRRVLPRNVIRQVSAELDEAEGLLNRAGSINAIQDESEYRRQLTNIRHKFLRIRMANHRAPGFFQQLRLLFGSAFIYKLYVLSSQIGAIKLQLELALDEQQLSSDIDLESGSTAAQPCPSVVMAIPTTYAAHTSPPIFCR